MVGTEERIPIPLMDYILNVVRKKEGSPPLRGFLGFWGPPSPISPLNPQISPSPPKMKFVESILSNNTTDDHCQEFVAQRGLRPLVTILGLPNLPVDFPTSAACQAVAGVCKSILVWGGGEFWGAGGDPRKVWEGRWQPLKWGWGVGEGWRGADGVPHLSEGQ